MSRLLQNRKVAIALIIVVLAMLVVFSVTDLDQVAVASHVAHTTFVWSHVGGDPLVPGGVWTKAKFVSLLSHQGKVRSALGLVVRGNGDPSWVLPAAYKNLKKAQNGSVKRGTKVGTMSYGSLRVSFDTLYMGQYNPLPMFYVVASKTTTVEINGKPYRQRISYWVSMAKK